MSKVGVEYNCFLSTFLALRRRIVLGFCKCKLIGGQAEGALIATNVYQAMFKKSLENKTDRMAYDLDGFFFNWYFPKNRPKKC